jgi:hypothetical protein
VTATARPPLLAPTLATMRRLVFAGSTSPTAAAWTSAAAWDGSHGDDRVALARSLAGKLREHVRYVPDPYGIEDVQALEATIERGAGDCEDFAVAFGALARAVGLRVGFATLERDDGTTTHVLPLIEDPRAPATWIPVEFVSPISFGTWPRLPAGASWRMEAIEDAADGGLGFLPILAGVVGTVASGVAGFLGAKESASATRSAGRAAVEAERIKSNAAMSAGRIALTAQRESASAVERNVERVVDFGTRALPWIVGAVALPALLAALGGRRRAPRARKVA